MTTTIPQDEDGDATAPDDEQTFHRGELPPGPVYDGITTDETEIDNRFREAFAFASFLYGGKYRIPSSVAMMIGEDHRRAHVRRLILVGSRRGRKSAGERQPSLQSEASPVEHEDGSLTITCATCGDEKPVNKFPTLKGGKGHRGTTCRACEARIRAEKKSGARA